jgi:hypothetical protein
MSEIRRFLAVAAIAAGCWLAMAFLIRSQVIAAIIFVPLALSTVGTLLLLAGLVASACHQIRCLGMRYVLAEAPLRAITGRGRPDYQRIATLEIEASKLPKGPSQ